jgi:hypothetical protein
VENHLGKGTISTVILANVDGAGETGDKVKWVEPDLESGDNLNVLRLNKVDAARQWRHDSDALAKMIIALHKEVD